MDFSSANGIAHNNTYSCTCVVQRVGERSERPVLRWVEGGMRSRAQWCSFLFITSLRFVYFLFPASNSRTSTFLIFHAHSADGEMAH